MHIQELPDGTSLHTWNAARLLNVNNTPCQDMQGQESQSDSALHL